MHVLQSTYGYSLVLLPRFPYIRSVLQLIIIILSRMLRSQDDINIVAWITALGNMWNGASQMGYCLVLLMFAMCNFVSIILGALCTLLHIGAWSSSYIFLVLSCACLWAKVYYSPIVHCYSVMYNTRRTCNAM